jgi:hypothetical protein
MISGTMPQDGFYCQKIFLIIGINLILLAVATCADEGN